jgi:manganese-dependent inorganic pyrophosphatase
MKQEDALDFCFFFVVDILKSEATLLVSDPQEKSLALEAFKATSDMDLLVLPGVVSRKKQIIPVLEPVIASK